MKTQKKPGLNAVQSKLISRCPYCGGSVVLRSADGIYKDNSRNAMLYVCANYPQCDAYVRVHEGTKIPVGTLANPELRALRKEAHDYFNRLYLTGRMSKDDAYAWLAAILQAPHTQAHIGHLTEYYCTVVIEECKKILARPKPGRKGGGLYVLERPAAEAG
jgi:ssDNA-binding Zn-finger/Zn-ribbon topoisomerase 1